MPTGRCIATDHIRLESGSRFALFATASLLLSVGYAVSKILTDPQIAGVTGVGVDTVLVLTVALGGWALLTSLAGIPFAKCFLTVVPLSLAFYAIRFVAPLPQSLGEMVGQLAFVGVLVFGTAAVAASIGYLPGGAVRRWLSGN